MLAVCSFGSDFYSWSNGENWNTKNGTVCAWTGDNLIWILKCLLCVFFSRNIVFFLFCLTHCLLIYNYLKKVIDSIGQFGPMFCPGQMVSLIISVEHKMEKNIWKFIFIYLGKRSNVAVSWASALYLVKCLVGNK